MATHSHHVLKHPQTNGIVLISDHSIDWKEYSETHEEMHSGKETECKDFITEWQDENDILPDDRMYLTIK